VIIFGSVRFLTIKNNQTGFFFLKKKPKPNRNRVKPTGFGPVRSGPVLDFKKPRKPICSYFFSNSSVRYLFTTIVFPALCKRIKSKKSTPLISSQIQNSAINQNPKFPGTGNLDFHISHWNWALHYSTQNTESRSKKQSNYITWFIGKTTNKLKDIHPTHTNKSFHGSSERLLTITFRMWCWLGLTGDGGLCNHVSHNTWIHVWSNPSKSRGRERKRERERGLRLGLLERKREGEGEWEGAAARVTGEKEGEGEKEKEWEAARVTGEKEGEGEKEWEWEAARVTGGGNNFFYL